MKDIDEMIEVMQAYKNGEQIEFCYTDEVIKVWEDTGKPLWNWGDTDYRVKPKPKYVPFETAEDFLEAQNLHGQVIIKYVDKDKTVFNQFYAYVNNLGKIILYDRGDSIRLLTLKQSFFLKKLRKKFG